MNTLKVVLIALAVIAVGCKGADKGGSTNSASGSSADASQQFIKSASLTYNLGDAATFSIADNFKPVQASWSVAGEGGVDLGTDCGDLAKSSITCKFSQSGKVTVHLIGTVRGDEKFDHTLVVTVLDPANTAAVAPTLNIAITSDSGINLLVAKGSDGEAQVAAEPTVFTFKNLVATILYKVRFDSGSAADDIPVSSSGSVTYTLTPGAHTVTFTAVDPTTNLSSSLTRVLYARKAGCTDVVIDTSKVTITSLTEENYFSFDARNAVSGGSGTTYLYKWDYNGDGVFDANYTAANVFVAKEYSTYGNWSAPPAGQNVPGTISPALSVIDQECGIRQTVFLDKVTPAQYLQVKRTDGVPGTLQGPQKPNYYFLGGIIQGLAGYVFPATSNDTFVTQFMQTTMPQKHVVLDYSKLPSTDPAVKPTDKVESKFATFHIAGLNFYHSDAKQDINQGLEIWSDQFTDLQGTAAGGPTTWTNAGTLRQVVLRTDGEPDGRVASIFYLNGTCNYQATFKIKQAAVPCVGGAATNSYALTLDGTFGSCKLTNNQGASIQLDKGAFYAEVASVNACVGGPGGAAGGVPPVPR